VRQGPWRPPVWPEPNDNIQNAIADMTDDVMTILGEKREGWPAKLRQLMSTQVMSTPSLVSPPSLVSHVHPGPFSRLSTPNPQPKPLPPNAGDSSGLQTLNPKRQTQVIPLGWESDYGPDKTTVAKIVFIGAKTLYEKGYDNQDLLSEGRTLAENAFEQVLPALACVPYVWF
jgi:hypothetical protein